MQPFYFGDSSSPRYGVFYPSVSGSCQDTCVLICNPIAQEYMRSHWALRQLAELLSKSGFPVMRFDYFGTGNSSGEFSDAHLGIWVTDTKMAIDELIALSGGSKVTLVGLRFGAMIASLAANHQRVQDLVLWDPVQYGLRYLTSLKVMHLTMLKDLGRFRNARRPPDDGLFREVLGFPLTRELEAEIEATDLNASVAGHAGRVAMFSSLIRDDFDEIEQKMVSDNVDVDYQKFADGGDWDCVELMDSALLVRAIPMAIRDYLLRQ